MLHGLAIKFGQTAASFAKFARNNLSLTQIIPKRTSLNTKRTCDDDEDEDEDDEEEKEEDEEEEEEDDDDDYYTCGLVYLRVHSLLSLVRRLP